MGDQLEVERVVGFARDGRHLLVFLALGHVKVC